MRTKPDFFLSVGREVTGDLATPRACWTRGRLRDQVRDDHMLVEIEPPLIGQTYGLGGREISSLIISSRYEGTTLFPVKEWPCHVYVARILDEGILKTLTFTRDQVEVIAWGMIFPTIEEPNSHEKGPPAMSPEPASKKFVELRVPGIRFVGEQDGLPERLLKDRLAELFRQHKGINTAYLARADLGNGLISVVLGLRAGRPDKQVVEKVRSIFASIFAGREHLDILFLSDAQEAQLMQVCSPFFAQFH